MAILDHKLLSDCFIKPNRSLRLDYKATDARLFSAAKFIWVIVLL